ncbi:hypothetical protein [Magnetococcus sp. PR-3]|uniref:hypothetical protein n=1 Tax=Magnetococcus sp. PR-3 TaxID=3120355 RepID=UPI002FCE6350
MSVFLEHAKKQFSRMLSRGDREIYSITHGCFDRTYWCWKFTDFCGSRFQESTYSLAWMITHPDASRAVHDHALVETFNAAVQFWTGLQHTDGSFDEAYPNERSLAATAFTGFYVGEAYLLGQAHLTPQVKAHAKQSMERLGDWLCRNDETHGVLTNHLAAAAAALLAAQEVTGHARFGQRSDYFIQRILDHQSEEGWYEEYGGADPGYQSHALFYLARCWQKTNSKPLLESMRRSVAFFTYMIYPNGTIGGDMASRNTEFYYPAGFEMLAPVCEDAARIAQFMRPAVERAEAVGLPMMDAYNFFPLLNNYLFAADHCDWNPRSVMAENPAPLPCEQPVHKVFEQAGILIHGTEAYHAVVGLSKGGVIRVYNRQDQALVLSHSGYLAVTEQDKVISNQRLTLPATATHDASGCEVESTFVRVNQRVMTPWLFMAFRIFTLTVGRSKRMAYWVKQQLVRVLINARDASPLTMKRHIIWAPDGVKVVDQLQKTTTSSDLKAMTPCRKFAPIHMGSSRYFEPQELTAVPLAESDTSTEKLLEELNHQGKLTLTWQWFAEEEK